jgi:hypothetical protein
MAYFFAAIDTIERNVDEPLDSSGLGDICRAAFAVRHFSQLTPFSQLE